MIINLRCVIRAHGTCGRGEIQVGCAYMVQRITKILHNGSESGSEWARDLTTYVYATRVLVKPGTGNEEMGNKKWETEKWK